MARTVRSLSAVRPLNRPSRPSRAGLLAGLLAPAPAAAAHAPVRPAPAPAVAG
ncbi:hypothetical protein ACF9IK_33310 [Kitasatospora hibisci]|uniref:hypothetical protein n=1 Tax=Kitasatospora hibisci TaxID=3369522 RepID=UPI00375406A6